MIKDKLHTITDEDAEEAARILLKSPFPYNYNFVGIKRIPYNVQDGTDSEESVDVYFDAVVGHESYRTAGWKNKSVCVKMVESDRYHNHPYFYGLDKDENSEKITWGHLFLTNQIEAIEFLQFKQYI